MPRKAASTTNSLRQQPDGSNWVSDRFYHTHSKDTDRYITKSSYVMYFTLYLTGDFVYVRSDEDNPFLARVDKLWVDQGWVGFLFADIRPMGGVGQFSWFSTFNVIKSTFCYFGSSFPPLNLPYYKQPSPDLCLATGLELEVLTGYPFLILQSLLPE